nr:hypothetical protein [Maricaulis sp.]
MRRDHCVRGNDGLKRVQFQRFAYAIAHTGLGIFLAIFIHRTGRECDNGRSGRRASLGQQGLGGF